MNKSKSLVVSVNTPVKQGRAKTNTTVTVKPSSRKKGRSRKRKNKSKGRGGLNFAQVKHSHYAASLHDPWGVRGARIPDERVVPTATVTSVFRGTLTSFANPTGGFNAGVMLRLGSLSPTSAVPADAGKPIIVAQGAVTGMEFNPVAPGQNFDFANRTALASSADRLRVVSAGVAVRPTLASTQNAGRTILTQYFGADNGSLVPFLVPNFINRNAFMKICPVNANDVCSIAYRPQSVSQGFEFRAVTATNWDQTLTVILDGLLAANLTFDISIVVNWEVIPSSAFAGILSTEKSFYDIDALMLAFNSAQGSDMFQSFPADAYDATNTMFSNDANQETIWSRLASFDPSALMAGAADAAEKIIRVAHGGFSAYRMYKGALPGFNAGYDRTKMIQYG